MPIFAPFGQILDVLDVLGEQGEGFEVDGLERGDLVSLAFDLGVEVGLVLEVVRVDVTVVTEPCSAACSPCTR